LKATKLIRQGCQEFLASVINTQRFDVKIEDIPVVSEYSDVLPEDLPGLPLNGEVKFVIDLLPKTNPISKAPYQMAPAEMKELKIQLQDLLDKIFIRPSVSP